MINKIETHIVPELNSLIRLPDYAIGIFSICSTKSALKKAIKKQYITVNGTIASTATYIKGGENITISIPKEIRPKKKLIFPLEVLFEDEYLAVINKPAGILVSGNSFKTIANALEQNLEPGNLPDAVKPQPVHRLDYATTGVLLIGKTSKAIQFLNQMFEDKQVKKIYYAVAIGEMNNNGFVNLQIDKKKANTEYLVYESVPSTRFGTLNLVQLKPKTGRRHQIRKHLSGLGNPILGDKDYGVEGLILNGKGLYLHAYSLAFKHPFTNKEFNVKANLPEKIKKIFPNAIYEKDLLDSF